MTQGCHFQKQQQGMANEDQKQDEPSRVVLQYDGTADAKWMDSIKHIDVMEEHVEEDAIYNELATHSGIFHWQGSTGFSSHNKGALAHIQPKWNNVKEFSMSVQLQNEPEK